MHKAESDPVGGQRRRSFVGHLFKRWRREITRITHVDGRTVERLPNDIEARAELVFTVDGFVSVVAGSEIHGYARRQHPFVLQIKAIARTRLFGVVDNSERDITRLIARVVRGQHLRRGAAGVRCQCSIAFERGSPRDAGQDAEGGSCLKIFEKKLKRS